MTALLRCICALSAGALVGMSYSSGPWAGGLASGAWRLPRAPGKSPHPAGLSPFGVRPITSCRDRKSSAFDERLRTVAETLGRSSVVIGSGTREPHPDDPRFPRPPRGPPRPPPSARAAARRGDDHHRGRRRARAPPTRRRSRPRCRDRDRRPARGRRVPAGTDRCSRGPTKRCGSSRCSATGASSSRSCTARSGRRCAATATASRSRSAVRACRGPRSGRGTERRRVGFGS